MAETVDELRITYPLGTRIRLDASAGSAGTVRYVGAIANHPGLWLGIEWDDAARGRHDGHVGDVRYFSTAAATSGSMIRPGRLAPRCSLRSAIERRYILSADHQLDERLMADTQRRLRASIFEIVGMDKVKEKQSHWDGLNIVAVQNSSVYMAGILTQLTHLSDLHLCDSLIGDWATVADILRQVPSVQLLNLSQNRLQAPSDAELVSLRPHFARLRAINLRDCGLSSWPSVLRLARMWPAIRDVSLQENGIAELPAAVDVVPAVDDAQPPCFGQLESLDLSGNEIVDFAEIINLGRLHTLRALNVAENRIATVQLPDCEADEYLDIFGGLVEINLKENPIADDVRAFNELDKLAALTTLLWTADGTADRGFEHLHTNAVARLTGLQQLNQMLVVPSERRGAEYDLWKALANEWLKTAQDEAGRRAFSRECRAYHRLVESKFKRIYAFMYAFSSCI